MTTKSPADRSPIWLPNVMALLVFIGLASANVVLWRSEAARVADQRHAQAEIVGAQTALRMQDFIDARLAVMENLARRWRAQRVADPRRFQDDALAMHDMFPGFQAINWIDSNGVIRWVTPPQGNQAALGVDVYAHPIAGMFLDKAAKDYQPHATFPLPLAQGGQGVVIYRRLEPKNPDAPDAVAPQGYLNAVFQIRRMMDRLLSSGISDAYAVRILDGDVVVHQRPGRGEVAWDLSSENRVRVADRSWTVVVAPTGQTSRANILGMVIGLVSALALSGLVWLVLRRQTELEERVRARTRDLEREVQERRKAEQEALLASSAKSRFLANVSHELRTPLNAIIGFSEAIEAGIYGASPDQRQSEAIGRIAKSGRHLLTLINDILDIAKIEAGTLRIEAEDTDLAEVTASAMILVEERARQQGVGFKNTVPADLPRVWVDDRRLKQVVLNLVTNAVKFTPAGGSVRVEGQHAADGSVRLFVRDTGIGMTEAEVEIALTAFGQVDGDLARRYEGTGLGLPLSRELVELMGCRLVVDSTPDKGTEVTVIIPANLVV